MSIPIFEMSWPLPSPGDRVVEAAILLELVEVQAHDCLTAGDANEEFVVNVARVAAVELATARQPISRLLRGRVDTVPCPPPRPLTGIGWSSRCQRRRQASEGCVLCERRTVSVLSLRRLRFTHPSELHE